MRITIAAAVAAALLAGCGSSTNGTTAASATAYRVTEDQQRGEQRFITVEVDSTRDLRGVFDAVLAEHTGDGGYFITIDCATGGTSSAANRLANGRAARGSKGAAVTGLKDGQIEFSANEGRTCPRTQGSTSTSHATAAKSSKRSTRSAAAKNKTRR